MTGLTQLLADCDAQGIQLWWAGDNGLTIDAPQDALTPDLMRRLKAHKSELMTVLANGPVTPVARRRAHAALVERVNAAYRGGPIDWPRLESIERRIETAATFFELAQVTSDYEQAAIQGTNTGLLDQYRV